MVQAVVWVSLRPMDLSVKTIEWGCNLGVVYVTLPLNLEDPLARLQNINQQIERLKTSPEPLVSNWLMSLFGFLPPCIGRPLWNEAAYKVTVSGMNFDLAGTWLMTSEVGSGVSSCKGARPTRVDIEVDDGIYTRS